jgi:ribosome-associated protein
VGAADAGLAAVRGDGAAAAGVTVTHRLVLPAQEFQIRATTSSGPGGQHVNRSATRIELRWWPAHSDALRAALTPAHRARVLARLAARLDADGALRVVASEYRSQRRNRESAEARLASLVRAALPDPVQRKATRPTRASVERRLEVKRRQGDRKRQRRQDDQE